MSSTELTRSHIAGIPPVGPSRLTGKARHGAAIGGLGGSRSPGTRSRDSLRRGARQNFDVVLADSCTSAQAPSGSASSRTPPGSTDTVQGNVFASAAPLEFSLVPNRNWERHQRLEL